MIKYKLNVLTFRMQCPIWSLHSNGATFKKVKCWYNHLLKYGPLLNVNSNPCFCVFQKGVPALTVDQPPEAEEVLLHRSQEMGVSPLLHDNGFESF